MTAEEKRIYAVIYKAVGDCIKKEMKQMEARIIKNMKGVINESQPAEKLPLSDAFKGIAQGARLHNEVNQTKTTRPAPKANKKKAYADNNILNSILNSTEEISGNGTHVPSALGMMNFDIYGDDEIDGGKPKVDPSKINTGNEALDGALGAQFKDYSKFMKKVAERDKTRKM